MKQQPKTLATLSEQTRKMLPVSLNGFIKQSRECFELQHKKCNGAWVSYSGDKGICECNCHNHPITKKAA